VTAIRDPGKQTGQPLAEADFVVVDLETTGTCVVDSTITEIAAVRVNGSRVLAEFQTLVDPEAPIPPAISLLTGITDTMVSDAPGISTALPAFLRFAEGAVLVAHNAPFDLGFLTAAAGRLDVPWPEFLVLDTAGLARLVVTEAEVTDHRLGTLARIFGSPQTPDHRALTDARATVHVLLGLLGRLAGLGVTSWAGLTAFVDRAGPTAEND
jgi:DNA polymerase III subunit epsilon